MAKNILHDVMAKDRRSIRHVPMPDNRDRGDDILDGTVIYEREEVELEEEGTGQKKRGLALWIAVGGFLVLLAVAVGLSFRGAKVTVTPKVVVATVDHPFSAVRSKGTNALTFESIQLSKSDETLIPAETEKRVSEKATGTIVVYNNFSEKQQRLIKNTRFETEEGLIYRIDRSIVIPGATMKNGKMVPGSIEVTVFADSPGDEYNIPMSDFSIPGFKSDPARYKGFYARSKTAMTGGFEGLLKTPSEASEREARATLRTTLSRELTEEVKLQVPEGYILYDTAIIIAGESLPLGVSGDKAVIKEKVSGVAYLFRKSELADAIIAKVARSYNGLKFEIPDLSQLHFSVTKAPEGESQELNFKLRGNARLVGSFDEDALKNALLGKPKVDLASVISGFSTIEKVDVIIRPFWSRSFPENPRKVQIIKASLEDGAN